MNKPAVDQESTNQPRNKTQQKQHTQHTNNLKHTNNNKNTIRFSTQKIFTDNNVSKNISKNVIFAKNNVTKNISKNVVFKKPNQNVSSSLSFKPATPNGDTHNLSNTPQKFSFHATSFAPPTQTDQNRSGEGIESPDHTTTPTSKNVEEGKSTFIFPARTSTAKESKTLLNRRSTSDEIQQQLKARWDPIPQKIGPLDAKHTFDRILQTHHNAVEALKTKPIPSTPFVVPRIAATEEHKLPTPIIQGLTEARKLASQIGIPNNRVFVHKEWESEDETILKGSHFWTHSADVGHFGSQRIPAASTNGFPRTDNFTEPLLPFLVNGIPRMDNLTFAVDRWVYDIFETSLDANAMAYQLIGSPQSFCGPLTAFVHDNYPMEDASLHQFWDRIDKEESHNRCNVLVGIDALRTKFPYHRSTPLGETPKSSKAKSLLKKGLPAPMRPIQDASAKDQAGCSINNCSVYDHLHAVTLPKVEHLIGDVLWAHQRCLDLGFRSSVGRIRCWKRDFKGAYRLCLMHPPDQWLMIFGIPDRTGKHMLFINDLVSAFGYRSAVTQWCRLAYSITTFTSSIGWCPKHFPQLALDPREGDELLTEPPPANTLNIEKFRTSPHGCADPLVCYRRRDYVDDAMIFTLNLHNIPDFIFSASSNTGVRDAAGKVESTKCGHWKQQVSIPKRRENGPTLSGLRGPTLLGFVFLLDTLMIALTPTYATDTIELANEFTNSSNYFSPKEWNTLAGKLGRVVMVYTSAKNLMREIWIIADISERKNRHYAVSKDIQDCLRLLCIIIRKNPGRDMRFTKEYRTNFMHGLDLSINAAHGLSDASTSVGLAIVNLINGLYYFRIWRWWERQVAQNKIFIFEAIGTYYLVRIMLSHLRNKRVVIWGDNEALVKALNNAASGDRVTNAIIRLISVDLALHNVVLCGDKKIISFNHCNTVEMGPYADALTRNKEQLFLDHIKNHHSGITPHRLSDSNTTIKQAEEDLHSLFTNFLQIKQTRHHRPSVKDSKAKRQRGQPHNTNHHHHHKSSKSSSSTRKT